MLDPAQLFNQALTALERGNRPLAKDRLTRILAARPDDCEAALILGQTLRADGDGAAAEAVLVSAIKASDARPGPADAGDANEVLLELADLRLALGRPGDAARACKRVLGQDPHSWEALYLLGNAFLDAGASREAENAYREALAINPFEGEVWWNLGTARERLGDATGAAQALAEHARLAAGADSVDQAGGPRVARDTPLS